MRFGSRDGRLLLVEGGSWRALDVAQASGELFPADPTAALEQWDQLVEWGRGADFAGATPVRPEELGPPVPHPRQVFAVALNYRPHAAEAGHPVPAEPLVFTKFPSCLSGPVTTVVLPPGRVDWEVEMVAVVGGGGYQIPLDRAWAALAGVTLGQDLSERVGQMAGTPPQFSLAKSHPGFGPTGPVLVTPDELLDRDDLAIEASVDGVRVQHDRTSGMIFPVDDLVHRISAVCPLLPGDLIFTGTPSGVGNRMDPSRFLQPGEALVSTLEGVGELRQRFVQR